jgi:uncharacterized protein YdaU (DUF1376 family)
MTDEKVDAFMPLWIGAYLADTMKFTTLQHGAYMLLLMAYWRDRAPLKDDDEELRGIAKADRSEWKKLRLVLAGKFRVADGVWWHKRVEQELAEAIRRKTAAVGKAQAAAQARWGKDVKHTTSNAPSNAPSIPQALHKECPTSTPEKELSKPTASHPPAKADGQKAPTVPCPYDAIVAAYHDELPTLPRVRLMQPKRQAALRKFWGWVLSSRKSDGTKRAEDADGALAWIAAYFGRAAENDFLMGRSTRSAEHAGWQCDIDFLLSDKGMKAVIEKTQAAAA